MKRKLFFLLCALLTSVGMWAQGTWTAPAVPGINPADAGGSTTYYLYNVESDAFVTYGMQWGSMATARRLHSGDQAASSIHKMKVSKHGDYLRFHLEDNKYDDRFLSDNGGEFGCYVDTWQGANNDITSIDFSYSSGSVSGAYTLRNVGTNHDLDVHWLYGGQLTGEGGQGFTDWAIVPESSITDGSYAKYKEKKQMYGVYQALVAAGVVSSYTTELEAANAVYVNNSSTVSQLRNATRTLINAAAEDIASSINGNSLFDDTDMWGNQALSTWTTTDPSNNTGGEYETYNIHFDFNQTHDVPNGLYKVVLHSLFRNDGGGAAPRIILTDGELDGGGTTASANVPLFTSLSFLPVNTAGATGNIKAGNENRGGYYADWVENNKVVIPNGRRSSADAMAHTNAVASVDNFKVTTGKMNIRMIIDQDNQWVNFQGFDIIFYGSTTGKLYRDLVELLEIADGLIAQPMNATVLTNLSNAITDCSGLSKSSSEKELEDAIAAVTTANAAAETSINIYSNINSAITEYAAKASALDAAGQEVYDASGVVTKYNNRTYETLAEAEAELSAAYRTAVKAQTTNGVDMTGAIVNHSFEDGEYTVGWNEGTDNDRGRKLNSNATYTISNADGSYIFNTWSQGTPLTQNIGTLHAGYYKLSAIIASDGATVYLMANNTRTAGVKTSDAKVGLTAEYLFYLSETTDDVNIGVVGCNGDYVAAGSWWYKADNFRLTYYSSLPDAPTAVEGKMKVSIAEGQSTAISAYNDDKTVDNYNAASAAVTLAQASVEAYKKMSDYLKTVETKVTNTTNFYTPTAYNNVYGNYKNGYENGTLTNEEATRSYQSASWQDTQRYDASTAAFLLIPGWTINDADATVSGSALYINSWSDESAGSGEAKDFANPFYEYYKGGGTSLDAATIVGTIPGLTGNAKYLVFANVRVEGDDKVDNSITMKVGNGTAVDVTQGNKIGTTTRYIKRYVAMGEADAEGNLSLTFTVAAESGIDWLSFRDINYVKVDEANNLDFTTGAVADGICIRTTAKDKTGNDVSGMQNVPGWSIMSNGDNHAAGVMNVNSDTKLGNPANVVPTAGYDAISNGKVLGIEAVWTATTQYIQAVTLPAGSYNLVMPIYNQGGTTALATNLFGFVELDGTTHYATTTAYEVGEWTEEVISFTLAEETTGYISLGYTAANTGNANMPHLFVDRVTIGNASANMAVNAAAQWGTFCAPFAVAIPSGVTAYTCASAPNGVLELTPQDSPIPANTPVILNAEGGLTSTTFYGVKVANESDDLITGGMLRGNVGTATKDVPSDGSAYLLQRNDGKTGFYQVNASGFKIGYNRCYLVQSEEKEAREAFFFEDDDPTAINAVEAVEAKAKGLKDGKYLINGRIVVVNNGRAFGANGQILK